MVNNSDELDEQFSLNWTASDMCNRSGDELKKSERERVRDGRVRATRDQVFNIIRSYDCSTDFKEEFISLFVRGMHQMFHGGKGHSIEHDVAALALHSAISILNCPKFEVGNNERKVVRDLLELYRQSGGELPTLTVSMEQLRSCFEPLGEPTDCEAAFQFIVRCGCFQCQALLPLMLATGQIQKGRSSEVFLIASCYDIAEQASHWFSEMNGQQKEDLGLRFSKWPVRSLPVGQWCEVMGIARNAFLAARKRIYSARNNAYPIPQQNRDAFFKPTSRAQRGIGLGELTGDEKMLLFR